MSRIEVTQKIEVYEINDEEVPIGKTVTIGVESHWNLDESVVLRIGRKSYTVVGNDLITATKNAMNTGD